MNTYLDRLTIIHFHYVEIKTVYPFARGEEIAPFLIETSTNVHKYLKDDAEIKMEVKHAIISRLISLEIALLSLSSVSLSFRMDTDWYRVAKRLNQFVIHYIYKSRWGIVL